MLRMSVLVQMVVFIIFGLNSFLRADFLAYAVTKKGDFPLPESIDDLALNAGKHLVKFRWGDYDGPKLRIGVLAVENRSSTGSYEGPDGEKGERGKERVDVGSIDALVIDALANTGRFTMVDREVLQELLAEQNLNDSGRASSASGAKSGKILGARFLVKVVIASYEPDYKSKKVGLGAITGGALGGVGMNTQKSMVKIVARLIDPETSEIVFSKPVEVVIGKKGFGVGASKGRRGKGQGGFFSSVSKTPIGHAVVAAINCATYELIKAMGNQRLKGMMVTTKGDRIILNLGADQVVPGDEFRAFSSGEEFVDPATGLSLGSEKVELGLLKVTKVTERFCFAQASDFDPLEIMRGDEVISTANVSAFEFAPAWKGPYPKYKRKPKQKNQLAQNDGE